MPQAIVSSLDSCSSQKSNLPRMALAGVVGFSLGVGTFGSSWAWEAEGQVAVGDALRRRAAEAVVGVLARNGSTETIRGFATQAIAAIAHPAADEALQSVADDVSRPEGVRQAARTAQAHLQIALRRR